MSRFMPGSRALRTGLAVLLAAACGAAAQEEGSGPSECSVRERFVLPEALRESSGLARSVREGGLLWTHNDGGAARLFAIDVRGSLRMSVTVEGAEVEDLEDIASGECAGQPCLLLADIGDNDANREYVVIHEVVEPAGDTKATLLRTLRLRYPDGARDAESLLVSGEQRFIITKGRHGAIALYRVPASAGADAIVVLEHVRDLGPEPAHERDRVTAASASPDGSWFAVRTYRTLRLYEARSFQSGGAPAAEYDLTSARESQGEGLVVGAGGEVWLSSEAERVGAAAVLTRLTCELPGAE